MNPTAGDTAVEANFDGLVGPTHHYAGLAFGNLASTQHAKEISNPREAAHQGLRKMYRLFELGLAQGVLPPHERPHLPTLRRLGFFGTDARILEHARRDAPQLLSATSSASAMWAANAASVSPSADTDDARVHFTPANLCSHLHRSLEAATTGRILRAIFADPSHFVHHPPLPSTPGLGDEGAANQMRLCSAFGQPGLELFVYGRDDESEHAPSRYPARQSRVSCETLARIHGLGAQRSLFVQQHPEAIDHGVFHNDVIAIAHREILLCHERAFVDHAALRAWICTHFEGERRPVFIEVPESELDLEDAVGSYLFNSQLVCPPGGGMRMIVARECEEQAASWALIQRIIADDGNPIDAVESFDLRQSMHNGGGPACLRLRVVLTAEERASTPSGVWLDHRLFVQLSAWIDQHFRDRLCVDDLADPQLLEESRTALDRLTRIMGLGSIYEFQMT